MTSEELIVEPDGSYEIILSATRHEGNWMELRPGARRFILRNGFYDWNNEVEASVSVEVVEGPMSRPVPHLTPSEFVSDMTALSLRLSTIPATMQEARDGWPLNDVNEPDPGAFGIPGAGVPSAVSSAGRPSGRRHLHALAEPVPRRVPGQANREAGRVRRHPREPAREPSDALTRRANRGAARALRSGQQAKEPDEPV